MRAVRICLILCAGLALAAAASAGPAALEAGALLQKGTRLKPGDYHLIDPGNGRVRITGSGFTVDFRGARITGDGQGVGLQVTDARDVTIRNAVVTGCRWGVVLERCQGVRLLDCNVSRNADLPPGTVIDESGREPEDQHGGGILLRDSSGCRVERCTAQHQWDGIDVVRSHDNVIQNGDFSYNGNWGVHFWGSSRNTFRENRAVWCTTGSGKLFQALSGWQTYDAQAVGIDHASCDNVIEGNDLRFGGDGIFIRANEGPQRPGYTVPPRNSSDRNILRYNDCSFSPNNAIEADLIAGTVIEGNNCSYSNYGMWLGYSQGTQVRGNLCVNDTTRAVEIENGQNITFEENVFRYDPPRPNAVLVYLRHNGRDQAIPSGPYQVRNNLFSGGKAAVELLRTRATLDGNRVPVGSRALLNVSADAESTATVLNNKAIIGEPGPEVLFPITLRMGSWLTLRGKYFRFGKDHTVTLTLDGIPLPIRETKDRSLRAWLPDDFWDRPAPTQATLKLSTAWGSVEHVVSLDWKHAAPRVERITPAVANPGEVVTVDGTAFLGKSPGQGPRVLLNGRPVTVRSVTDTRLTFLAPTGMLLPTRYNLVLERGQGLETVQSAPVTYRVELKPEQLPHLTSARFSPTRLHVGELLRVEFTVRNNLPYPAPLQATPKPPFTYGERQAFFEMGTRETRGALHLRVTSDHPGAHEPGSWPWFFGFPKAELAPGETITVTGAIRVETPGEHEFRVGLVAGGGRFIDDNAYRTRITILP